ncbi:hypothetical protein HF086_017482 [Spodoptera exigua]|uniref:Uncharacterized protein n=1 Tax=Spodoptera exigua TaxID=7107 RepID=A0A922M429_SPOEX|nr:hypothetical protein HF086_017482 [Spodoptera exigua]
MASKISYFVIINLVIFANGSPAYREDLTEIEPQYNMKDLVEKLYEQGNYDFKISHHEDRPGKHHEDVARISYQAPTKGRYYNNNEKNRLRDTNRDLNYNKQSLGEMQGYYHLLKKLGRTDKENDSKDSEKNCMKKLGKCIELKWPSQKNTNTRTHRDTSERIVEYLNALDEQLDLVNNNKHDGDKTYKIYDVNDNQYLRCVGDRCNRGTDALNDNDDDENNKYGGAGENTNIQPCIGPSCGSKGLHINDDAYEADILRCAGVRCSEFYTDDRDNIDTLRCIRDRCIEQFSESLRCVENKCDSISHMSESESILRNIDSNSDSDSSRNDDDDDDDVYSNDDDDNNNVNRKIALTIAKLGLNNVRCNGNLCYRDRDDSDNLRCSGKTCSRDRDDDDDDNNDNDDDGIGLEGLRCIGDRCSWDRDEDGDQNDKTKVVRCSGNRCNRNRDDDGDLDRQDDENNSYTNNSKDEDLFPQVDILLTNVLGKHLRTNTILKDKDVQMILKERNKIMEEVKKILIELKNKESK